MSEMKNTRNQLRRKSEIAIKFGKGLAKPFTSKDGMQYMRILIPNKGANDKSPWQHFVVPAKSIHESRYGKGLWIRVPLYGNTTVSRDVRIGYDESGKGLYERQRRSVTNIELKTMVEYYKSQEWSRSSDAPEGMKQEAADPDKAKTHRSCSMER